MEDALLKISPATLRGWLVLGVLVDLSLPIGLYLLHSAFSGIGRPALGHQPSVAGHPVLCAPCAGEASTAPEILEMAGVAGKLEYASNSHRTNY
jgi:hypothetical protein